MVSMEAYFCKRCNVVHFAMQCPREQLDADNAEKLVVAVARSTFTRWASGYIASLSALRDAGVKLGKEYP
jgi:hypothetical protein